VEAKMLAVDSVDQKPRISQLVAFLWLDLDDAGAEIGQPPRRQGARQHMAEIQDPNALEKSVAAILSRHFA
jgi:hypothetical protein